MVFVQGLFNVAHEADVSAYVRLCGILSQDIALSRYTQSVLLQYLSFVSFSWTSDCLSFQISSIPDAGQQPSRRTMKRPACAPQDAHVQAMFILSCTSFAGATIIVITWVGR